MSQLDPYKMCITQIHLCFVNFVNNFNASLIFNIVISKGVFIVCFSIVVNNGDCNCMFSHSCKQRILDYTVADYCSIRMPMVMTFHNYSLVGFALLHVTTTHHFLLVLIQSTEMHNLPVILN